MVYFYKLKPSNDFMSNFRYNLIDILFSFTESIENSIDKSDTMFLFLNIL